MPQNTCRKISEAPLLRFDLATAHFLQKSTPRRVNKGIKKKQLQ